MSKHTAGPWEICHGGHGSPHGFVIDEYYVLNRAVADDVAIAAEIIDPATGKPSEANARLIAAAPELLESLEGFLTCWDSCSDPREFAEKARAAIAKAAGE